jgi:hypothetical protein
MLYCGTYESFVFWGCLPEVRVLKAFIFVSAFAAIRRTLGFCFAKTYKLKKEELSLLCLNIRYMGCPKRPGQ